MSATRAVQCMEWKPIETAPTTGNEVLIGAFYKSGHFHIEKGEYCPVRGWRPHVGQDGNPSHWMPLPKAPERPEPDAPA